MNRQSRLPVEIECHPVTLDRWRDLVKLFGGRGACAGCWCMYWRMLRSDFDARRGSGTKRALKKLVTSGQTPGLLAYAGDEPIGWISVGPRQDFAALERSRILKRVDDQPVWSVVCFFVARPYRRQGITVELLKAAIKYARQHGAKIVEGYPVEPKNDQVAPAFVYTGLASAFLKAGFTAVMRRSETRPIMRYIIE
jgi:GNAT superfamily N-acetyltransferase